MAQDVHHYLPQAKRPIEEMQQWLTPITCDLIEHVSASRWTSYCVSV
jgi:hypothetical protein